MIHITIKYDNAFDIQIQGHAGYAVKGHDIVCAAISTLYQTLVLAFQEYAYGGFQRGLFQTPWKSKTKNYRGHVIRVLDFQFDEDYNEFIKDYVPGGIIKYNSYISCSIKSDYNPDARVTIGIDSRHGKDIRKVNPEEEEILYPRDSVFYVESVDDFFGKTIIYLKELENEK